MFMFSGTIFNGPTFHMDSHMHLYAYRVTYVWHLLTLEKGYHTVFYFINT